MEGSRGAPAQSATPRGTKRRLWIIAAMLVAIVGLVLYKRDARRRAFDIYGDVGHLGKVLPCDERNTDGRPVRDLIGCMVEIPAATVLLGAQSTDPRKPGYDPAADADEGPPHTVTFKRFRIQRHEVSAKQYERCVAEHGCQAKDVITTGGAFTFGDKKRAVQPINGVTWFGARDYCHWIGGRLPTEAEWEYAARGAAPRIYPWGNEPPDCDRAVLADERGLGCGNDSPRRVNDHPLKFTAAFFLLHTAGNVWEWVNDWYDEGYYAKAPTEAPQGPESGTRKVQRGGGWTVMDAKDLRVSARAALDPTAQLEDLGFRCAGDLP